MNFRTNNGQKVVLTGCWKRDSGIVNRLASSMETTKCRTEENVDTVNDLFLSQEDTLQTHRMVREISSETDIWLRCYETIIVSLVAAFY